MQVVEVVVVSLITSGTIFWLVFSTSSCTCNGLWTCRDSGNWGEWCQGVRQGGGMGGKMVLVRV